jgi:hypothetical protein
MKIIFRAFGEKNFIFIINNLIKKRREINFFCDSKKQQIQKYFFKFFFHFFFQHSLKTEIVLMNYLMVKKKILMFSV